MAKKILIMGLPGAGKTYLAERLAPILNATWLNADEVRKNADDWDFSSEGRIRQSNRMKNLAQKSLDEDKHVIADFVCPTPKTRADFNADITIWLDTIVSGRYEDTNKMFIAPEKFDFRITEKKGEIWAMKISNTIEERSFSYVNRYKKTDMKIAAVIFDRKRKIRCSGIIGKDYFSSFLCN